MANHRDLILERHRHLKWKALDWLEALLMVLCGVCISMFTLAVFCDVVTRSLGVPWLWLQQVTTAFFAWGVFTADILADIVITGSFGLIWCILELHYIPFVPMETIIMFAISILFVYVRFLLFKPTQ